MQRRHFFLALAGTGTALLLPHALTAATDPSPSLDAIRNNWRSLLPADTSAVAALNDPLTKTEADWRSELSEQAFYVLFEDGTERPFSSPLNDQKAAGIYACAACRLPLFTSQMKYDSGTGWPSFFTAIPGHLDTSIDFKLIYPRTEYHCIRCGGHQGHRFSDGPAPTGERWCNNGVALDFIPSDSAA